MKKFILSSILATLLTSSLNAYELNGNLDIKWTGFKTEKKSPVSGTFKGIDLQIKSSDDLAQFLQSAKVTIDTSTIFSKNPYRDKNIMTSLFFLDSAKLIKGQIISIDSEKNSLVLNLTMNEVSKKIPMTFSKNAGNIIAKGSIDILDFEMKSAFLTFAKKCAAFHQRKSYSDVDIEFTLPFK